MLTVTSTISPTIRHTHILIFFFNDTATTEIYTLSLHDALPISNGARTGTQPVAEIVTVSAPRPTPVTGRSEEHTSELQSHLNLVCRLLLEKKIITVGRVALHFPCFSICMPFPATLPCAHDMIMR